MKVKEAYNSPLLLSRQLREYAEKHRNNTICCDFAVPQLQFSTAPDQEQYCDRDELPPDETEQQLEAVKSVLPLLTEKQRKITVLLLEGHSFNEINHLLNLKHGDITNTICGNAVGQGGVIKKIQKLLKLPITTTSTWKKTRMPRHCACGVIIKSKANKCSICINSSYKCRICGVQVKRRVKYCAGCKPRRNTELRKCVDCGTLIPGRQPRCESCYYKKLHFPVPEKPIKPKQPKQPKKLPKKRVKVDPKPRNFKIAVKYCLDCGADISYTKRKRCPECAIRNIKLKEKTRVRSKKC